MFDTRAQRRSVWAAPLPGGALSCLQAAGERFFLGDNLGHIRVLDRRRAGALRVLKTHSGGVAALELCAGLLVSAGSDRFVRLTALDGLRAAGERFLPQLPTALLLPAGGLALPPPPAERLEELDSAEEEPPAEAEHPRRARLRAALGDARLLRHNSVRLPYQKRAKGG